MVPFGPRLLLSTSWSPRAALMLTAKAAWALATSAFGLRALTAAMVKQHEQPSKRIKYRRHCGRARKESRFQKAPTRVLVICSRKACTLGHSSIRGFPRPVLMYTQNNHIWCEFIHYFWSLITRDKEFRRNNSGTIKMNGRCFVL